VLRGARNPNHSQARQRCDARGVYTTGIFGMGAAAQYQNLQNTERVRKARKGTSQDARRRRAAPVAPVASATSGPRTTDVPLPGRTRPAATRERAHRVKDAALTWPPRQTGNAPRPRGVRRTSVALVGIREPVGGPSRQYTFAGKRTNCLQLGLNNSRRECSGAESSE
jgi:hypothetical protein